jgi:hypothetical protein
MAWYPLIYSIGCFVLFASLVKISRWIKDMIIYDRPPVENLLTVGHKWEQWFAWRPVRTIKGKIVWLETVYRLQGNTYVDHDDWAWYYYADVFDYLSY